MKKILALSLLFATNSLFADDAPNITSPNAAVICSGGTVTIALTTDIEANFTWIANNNPNTTGESTTIQTTSTLSNTITNTSTSAQIVTYTITATHDGHTTTQTVTVTVYPKPLMTSASAISICSGNLVSIPLTSSPNSTYTWIATNNPNTTGESITIQSNNLLNNTIINLLGTSQIVTYTVTPTSIIGSCLGTPQTVTVTVNPKPIMTSTSAISICSENLVSIPLASSPASTYTWIATNNPNTTGESITIQSTNTLSNSITNNSVTAENVVYTVTPTSTIGNCSGTTQTVTVTVNPKPIMTSASMAIICSEETVNIPLTSSTTATYSWIANNNANTTGESTTIQSTNILSNSITNNSVTAENVVYTVTPISTIGNCSGAPQTVTVTVKPKPIITLSSNTQSFCDGGSTNITITSSVSGTTISWNAIQSLVSGATSGTSYLITDILNITSTSQGSAVYTVTSSADGCLGIPVNTTVTVNPIDDASFNYPNSTFCESGTNPLPFISGYNGGLFSSTSGLTFTSMNTGEIDLASSTLGTYIVTYTTTNLCPNTNTANVTITNAPIAAFSFPSNATSFCQSDSNPLPLVGGGAFIGSFNSNPNGLVFANSSGQIDLINSIPGVYTITNTIAAANGCATSIDSLLISINLPATANAGVDGTICSGKTFTVSGATIGGSAINFAWTTSGSGNFDNSNTLNAIYTPSNADIISGSVVITITTNDPVGVCGAVSDDLVLTINATPQPPIVENNAIFNCIGAQVDPINATGTGGIVTWYSDAALLSIINTGNTFTPVGLTTSTSLWLTETVGSCQSDPEQVSITLNPLPVANASGIAVTQANCGETGSINGVTIASGQMPYTFLWVDSNSNNIGNNLDITNLVAGAYSLTVTDGNGCSSTLGPVAVSSTTDVVSDFSVSQVTGETPLSVNFTNNSTGATNYLWQFGTTETSTESNPTYIYIPLGNFTVCLIASNDVGCADTTCSPIDVYINSTFVIPNVFTPNSDNVNDLFFIQSKGLESMDTEIYNRWGIKVFEWHTIDGAWDGRNSSGDFAPEGTYYFILKATGVDGKKYLEKGALTLMR